VRYVYKLNMPLESPYRKGFSAPSSVQLNDLWLSPLMSMSFPGFLQFKNIEASR